MTSTAPPARAPKRRSRLIDLPAGVAVKIGVCAVSGAHAPFGAGLVAGARMACGERDLRGRPISLVVADEPLTDQEARSCAARFAREDVIGVIGPMTLDGCRLLIPHLEARSVLTIVPSVRNPELTRQGYRHVLRLDFDGGAQSRPQAVYAEYLGRRTAVVLPSTSVYWTDVADGFVNEYRGRTLVRLPFDASPATHAYTAAEALRRRPELIYLAGDAQDLVNLLREFARRGPPPTILSCAGLDRAALDAASIPGLSDVHGTLWTAPDHKYPEFAARFRELHADEPPYYAPEGYDAVGLLVEIAHQLLGSDHASVIDRMALSTHARHDSFRYVGVTGTLGFDDRGDRRDPGDIRVEPFVSPPGVKTKVLYLAASPTDWDRLRNDQEARDIHASLGRAGRSTLRFESRFAVRPRDLREAMLDVEPHFVHFAGHGAGTHGLVLEDDQGEGRPVTGEALAALFALFPDVRCVVLNACYSEVQARAIAEHVPYVIGLAKSVDDLAAVAFATAFYDALAAGKSVEFAFGLARAAVLLEGLPADAEPVLHLRHPPAP